MRRRGASTTCGPGGGARKWGHSSRLDDYAYHNPNSTLWGWGGQNPIRWRDPTGHDVIGTPNSAWATGPLFGASAYFWQEAQQAWSGGSYGEAAFASAVSAATGLAGAAAELVLPTALLLQPPSWHPKSGSAAFSLRAWSTLLSCSRAHSTGSVRGTSNGHQAFTDRRMGCGSSE
jgi:hypothetical protein